MLNYRSTSRPICLLVYLLALLAAPWGCGTSDAFVETGLTPATGAIIEVDAGERGTNSSVSFGGLRIGATDKNGLLFLPQLLPDDVEVHAELPVLAQSSDPPNALIVNSKLVGPAAKLSINVPNHLVTALVRSDAGLSYDEAENRIRKFLVIESQWNLSSLEESLSSPFSHRAFFDEAARSGGIEEFTSQLLREESAGLTHPFPGTLGSGDESSILASLAENVAADIVSDGASDVIGWLARALGFGLGGSDNQEVLDALQNVENTLNQQFAQFREELTFTNLKTEVTDPISSDTTDFYQTAQGIIPASPPFSLYSLSSGVSALLQILEQRDYWTVITSLFSTLIGSDETVAPPPNSPGIALRPERLIAGEIYPKVGIDSGLTTTYQGYGAFSNSTLKPVHDWHTYYRAYGVLAMNLLAESAHATVDGVGSGGPSLAEAIRVLQIRLSGTTELGFAALYKAPDQLVPPLLPSDQVFVDLENGLMWCTVARGDLTYSQSVQFANSLSVGPYQNWRVPYVFELDSLYARIDGGWQNLTSAERSGKKKSAVLEGLGFDLSKMSDTHHCWAVDAQSGLTQPSLDPVRYSLDTGDNGGFGSHHDLLLVRSYDENMDGYFSDAEMRPGLADISINVTQGAGGVTKLQAVQDWGVVVGRSFTINGASQQPTKIIIDGSAVIYQPLAEVVGFAEDKDITNRVVWTSSSDDDALISNLPGEEGTVYWRSQVFGLPSKPVTFTATYQSYSAKVTLSPPTDIVWEVTGLNLTPFKSALLLDGSSTKEVIYVATVFLKNPANGDTTTLRNSFIGGDAAAPPVSWSVEDSNGNPIAASQAGFPDPSQSRLVVNSSLGSQTIVIKATSGGQTETTTLQVSL